MHNCKLTRRDFVDLALDEIPAAKAKRLLAELNDCEACQVEYAALRSTLHVSNRALRSSLPAEEFWRGYHSRLQAKLVTSEVQRIEEAVPLPLSSRAWFALRTFFATSVRVPVPAALGLILLFGASFFLVRARTQVNASPSAPVALVETKTIEVPVIQEKVVTRVVYVEKQSNRSNGGANGLDRKGLPAALTGSDPGAKTAMSLAGFKPTDEVKLTVIKGSDKDEKR
jgi:anti-sigma factor RsiW